MPVGQRTVGNRAPGGGTDAGASSRALGRPAGERGSCADARLVKIAGFDVNPLRREVVFGRQVINQNGTHTCAEVGSKTGDWRTVPGPQPVIDALTAHIARYRDGAARDDLVFTNPRDGHVLRGNFGPDAVAPAVRRGVTFWVLLPICVSDATLPVNNDTLSVRADNSCGVNLGTFRGDMRGLVMVHRASAVAWGIW
jgi:hypothetical protein